MTDSRATWNGRGSAALRRPPGPGRATLREGDQVPVITLLRTYAVYRYNVMYYTDDDIVIIRLSTVDVQTVSTTTRLHEIVLSIQRHDIALLQLMTLYIVTYNDVDIAMIIMSCIKQMTYM